MTCAPKPAFHAEAKADPVPQARRGQQSLQYSLIVDQLPQAIDVSAMNERGQQAPRKHG
jgi:hypothetical protein